MSKEMFGLWPDKVGEKIKEDKIDDLEKRIELLEYMVDALFLMVQEERKEIEIEIEITEEI